MDLRVHYTHWNVRADLYALGQRICERYGGTWNTYNDHPPGMGLDATSLDFWGDGGRGYPVGTRRGNKIVNRLIYQKARRPIRWMIWRGFIWHPDSGWTEYDGWQGLHYDHVHVTFL